MLSGRKALGLASMLGVTAVGAVILVNFQYELVQVTMAMLAPNVPAVPSAIHLSNMAIANIQSRDSTILLFGGGLLTALLLATSLVALAVCSSRRPGRALIVFSALCLAVISAVAI